MISSSGHQVLIYHRNGQAYQEILSNRLPKLKMYVVNRPEEGLKFAEGVEIIIASPANLTGELIRRAKNLAWLFSTAAGTDKLLKITNIPRSVIITKGTGQSKPMADYVFAYLLYYNKRIAKHLEDQRNKVWDQAFSNLNPSYLEGQTIGVLGLGYVGQAIAKRGKEFGMNVLGVKRNPEPVKNVDQIFGPAELDRIIPLVDCLVVALPFTQATYHFLGERELLLMKEGALLINIGRGEVIDEMGLVKVLKTKRIRAVLDVFKEEPLPPESELWGMENVIVTPHVSGINIPTEICEEFIANYERWVRGETLKGVVHRESGY